MAADIKDDPKMELHDINQKLQEEGMDACSSDEQKISYLWQLYIKTEAHLKASLESIEQLRRQQDDEMKEVENYMQHIRSLSDEREALTLEFEAENDQLKTQVDGLKHKLAEAQSNEETKQMLLQQGLDDIVDGSTGEQVAFLLVERARLMDELESEQGRVAGSAAAAAGAGGADKVGELREMLERERAEFEEELEQQSERVRRAKEQTRTAHEDEMATMIDENEQLQEMLNDTKRRLIKYQEEIKELKAASSSQPNPQATGDTASGRAPRGADVSQQASEMESLVSQLATLRSENEKLKTNINELNAELLSEKEESDEKIEERDITLQKLRDEIDRQQRYITELQSAIQRTNSDRKNLEIQLNIAEQEREDLELKQRQMKKLYESNAGKPAPATEQEDFRKQKVELEDLRKEREKAAADMSKLQDDLAQRSRLVSSLQADLALTKSDACRVSRLERENEALQAKIKLLEDNADKLEEKICLVQKESQKMKTDSQKWEQSAAATERSASAAKQTLEALRTEHAGCGKRRREEAEELSRRREEEEERCAALRTELSRLQRRADTLEATKHQANLSNEALQQQLLDLKSKDVKTGDRKDEQLTQLQNTVKEKVAEIERLAEENWQMGVDKGNLAQRVTHSETRLSEMEQELETTEEEFAGVKRKLRQRSEELEELQKEKRTADLMNENLTEKREEADQQRTELSKQTHIKDTSQQATISELESRLSSAGSRLAETERQLSEVRSQVTAAEERTRLSGRELGDENTRLSNAVNDLKNRMAGLSESHKQEMADCLRQIDIASGECRDFKEKFEENKYSYDMESKQHSIIGHHNKQLEAELKKSREKVTELIDKNSQLNTDKDSFKSQFEKISHEKKTNEFITEGNMTSAESRACEAEKKATSMQHRLDVAEQQLRSLTSLKAALREKEVEIESFKMLAEQESLQSIHSADNVDRLQQQTTALRRQERLLEGKNSELQHTLLDVEAKLEGMKEQSRQRANVRQTSDERTHELATEVSGLQRQVESLRRDIHLSVTRYDGQVKKYSERKLRTKVKLQKAREHYNTERDKYRHQADRLRSELSSEKVKTSDEQQWREKTQLDNRKLVTDKRDLITQVSEAEETRRDHERRLALLRVRCSYLEEENRSLSEHVVSLRTRVNVLAAADARAAADGRPAADNELKRALAALEMSDLLSPPVSAGSWAPEGAAPLSCSGITLLDTSLHLAPPLTAPPLTGHTSSAASLLHHTELTSTESLTSSTCQSPSYDCILATR